MERYQDDAARFEDGRSVADQAAAEAQRAADDEDRRRQGADRGLAMLTALLLPLDDSEEDGGFAGIIGGGGGGGGNRPTVDLTDFNAGGDQTRPIGDWVSVEPRKVRHDGSGGGNVEGVYVYEEALDDQDPLGTGYADVEVEATIAIATSTEYGVVVRATLDGNDLDEGIVFWGSMAIDGYYELGVYSAGIYTTIWNVALGEGFEPIVGTVLKLRMVGDTYTVWRNGVQLSTGLTVGPNLGRSGVFVRSGATGMGFGDVHIRQLEPFSA